jgi:hypothetical protein
MHPAASQRTIGVSRSEAAGYSREFDEHEFIRRRSALLGLGQPLITRAYGQPSELDVAIRHGDCKCLFDQK